MIEHLGVLLMFFTAAPQSITQNVSEWCNPVFNNVIGNINVTCIGVDPRALKRLNHELSMRTRELNEKIREANQWAARYNELKQSFSALGDSPLRLQALEHLEQGELEEAQSDYQKLINQNAGNVALQATLLFASGELYELQFMPEKAQEAFGDAYRFSSHTARLQVGTRYADFLFGRRDFRRAELILNDAIEIGEQAIKDDPKKNSVYLIMLLTMRGGLYLDTNKLSEAQEDAERAIKIAQDYPRGCSILAMRVSDALSLLAQIYRKQGHSAAAARIYEDLLRVHAPAYDKGLLPLDIEGIHLLTSLGDTYHDLLEWKTAGEKYEQALDIIRDLVNSSGAQYQKDLAFTLEVIGDFYSDECRYAARSGIPNPQACMSAEQRFNEAIGIYRTLEKLFGVPYDYQLAAALHNRGNHYIIVKRMPEAEADYKLSRDKFREMSPSQQAMRPHEALVNSDLGQLYLSLGQMQNAETSYSRALSIYDDLRKHEPDEYLPRVADSLYCLATIHVALAKFDLAKQEIDRAKKINIYLDREPMLSDPSK